MSATADFRAIMKSKSREDLAAIVAAPDDVYTPEARAAAQEELDSRPLSGEPEAEAGEIGEPRISGLRWFGSAVSLWFAWGSLCAAASLCLWLTLPAFLMAAMLAVFGVVAFHLGKHLNQNWPALLRKIMAIIGVLTLARFMIVSFPAQRHDFRFDLLLTTTLSFIAAAVFRPKPRHDAQSPETPHQVGSAGAARS